MQENTSEINEKKYDENKTETWQEELEHTDRDLDNLPDISDSNIDPTQDKNGNPKPPAEEEKPTEQQEEQEDSQKEQHPSDKQAEDEEKPTERQEEQEDPKKEQHPSDKQTEKAVFDEGEKELAAEAAVSTPFLAPLVDKEIKAIAKLKVKKTKHDDKIVRQEGKIEKLTARLNSEKAYCDKIEGILKTGLFSDTQKQFFEAVLTRRKDKIKALESNIDDRRKKVEKLRDSGKKIDAKIEKRQKKVQSYTEIDKFMSNMLTSDGRKENFVSGLEKMRDRSVSKATERLDTLEKKVAELRENPPATRYVSDQIKYKSQLERLETEKDKISERIAGIRTQIDEGINVVKSADEKQADKIITDVHNDIENTVTAEPPQNPDELIDKIVDVSGDSLSSARHLISENSAQQEVSAKQKPIKMNANEFEVVKASGIRFDCKTTSDKSTYFVLPMSSKDAEKINNMVKAVRNTVKSISEKSLKTVTGTSQKK